MILMGPFLFRIFFVSAGSRELPGKSEQIFFFLEKKNKRFCLII